MRRTRRPCCRWGALHRRCSSATCTPPHRHRLRPSEGTFGGAGSSALDHPGSQRGRPLRHPKFGAPPAFRHRPAGNRSPRQVTHRVRPIGSCLRQRLRRRGCRPKVEPSRSLIGCTTTQYRKWSDKSSASEIWTRRPRRPSRITRPGSSLQPCAPTRDRAALTTIEPHHRFRWTTTGATTPCLIDCTGTRSGAAGTGTGSRPKTRPRPPSRGDCRTGPTFPERRPTCAPPTGSSAFGTPTRPPPWWRCRRRRQWESPPSSRDYTGISPARARSFPHRRRLALLPSSCV